MLLSKSAELQIGTFSCFDKSRPEGNDGPKCKELFLVLFNQIWHLFSFWINVLYIFVCTT